MTETLLFPANPRDMAFVPDALPKLEELSGGSRVLFLIYRKQGCTSRAGVDLPQCGRRKNRFVDNGAEDRRNE